MATLHPTPKNAAVKAPFATLTPPPLNTMLHPDIPTERKTMTFLLGFYR